MVEGSMDARGEIDHGDHKKVECPSLLIQNPLSTSHMEKLKQLLAQDDTVLFVGSGISLWSGLPSWPELIEKLATFIEAAGEKADLIRAEAQRGDLLQAASYGFDKLTKQQIGDFIRGACRYGIATPHEVHRKIVSLGPRCFITTNYDNLIEESLRLWQPNRFFRPPVTNRHLTETAEVVHARAIDFVFKPHGDAADSDSIILTREQYRQLLPGGERQAALESVKMLLASRPVVYLGFGLRDPDFIYVRDLLANTYKGGTRDHYAIMPDVSEAEVDYWRRHYGIHLAGYTTTERVNKSRDHGAFLSLLDELLRPTQTIEIAAPTTDTHRPYAPEFVLALARHAARLTRPPKNNPEFPIRVHLEKNGHCKQQAHYQFDVFDSYPVDKFLDEGPPRSLLIGLPGAGKSYSLQQAAARTAEKLHQICLTEPFEYKNAVVPLFADLKLYRGKLRDLLNSTLPNGLSLESLAQQFNLKIFLDSFNEMPRSYWENGSYEGDFSQFVENIGNASIIIGSRTSDGLSKFGFPSYSLDEVDGEFVQRELRRLNIEFSGRFEREIRRLLQKPFYFRLVTTGSVSLPKNAHPRDIYESFFNALTQSFESRFGKSFDLERALSLTAYKAINKGEEAQPLADVLKVLKSHLEGAGITEIHSQDVANWLVSKSVFIPYTGSRVAFFHQSATEYLAAAELARRYQACPHIVKEKLSLTRWDQALFLTLSLLPPDRAAAFLQAVIEADFVLALKATKYLESGRDKVVASLLSEIPSRIESLGSLEHKIEFALEFGVPLTEVHEPELRTIMKYGGSIGAAAVTRLIQLKGPSLKDELLQALIEHRDDYNYCRNGIAPALKPFITTEDVGKLAAIADSLEDEVIAESDEDTAQGFISGCAHLLAGINISVIRHALLPNEVSAPLSEVRARILCDLLREHHSTPALELAGDLLLRGVSKAATTIYFIVRFSEPEHELSWTSFGNAHAERLLSLVKNNSEESWPLEALGCLCQARKDIAEAVKTKASKASGILKAALLHCACSEPNEHVFDALAELALMDEEHRRAEPTYLLAQIDLSWPGHESLFLQLLKLRDAKLAVTLIDMIYTKAPFENSDLGDLEIGPVGWWLEWLSDEKDSPQGYWFRDRISWLFSRHTRSSAREEFVFEFNKPDSKFREVLANSILLAQTDLTTDSFSEDAISFLLADITKERVCDRLHGHLLGNSSTEIFVTERLLPLLSEATGPLLRNLRTVLIQAGSRHGRRYVTG